MGTFIDLTNKRFGKLVVLRKYKKIGKYWKWECVCDCNLEKIIIVDGSSLRTGNTQSCGCLHKEITGNINRGKRINTKPEYSVAFNRLYNIYKRNAKTNNLLFELSPEFFAEIINKNCFYCGDAPYQTVKDHRNLPINGFYYNGIDKIDPNKGYVENNVVSCCWKCNNAKSNLNQNDFFEWIKKVYLNIFQEIK